jgi:hypothetical protein
LASKPCQMRLGSSEFAEQLSSTAKIIQQNPKGPDRDADKVIECELNGCLGKAGPRVASSGKQH